MKQVRFKPGVKERKREGVTDEQNGESKEEQVMGEGIDERQCSITPTDDLIRV